MGRRTPAMGPLVHARVVKSAVVRADGVRMRDDHGQGIVEFAVVLPVLMILLMGLIEFGFFLNALNSVNYASRDAAMLAAEGGRNAGADCVVLQAVERALTAPTSPARVERAVIYWSDANGVQMGSNENRWERIGSTTCTYGDGSTITVPYTLTVAGYVDTDRCDVLAGCGASHPTVDTIGVRITYRHEWVTGFGRLIAGTISMVRATAVRMEPTL